MRYSPKPTTCCALAVPVLLAVLPAALAADQDKLGPVLPPPSLYDAPPTGQPAAAPAAPSVPMTAVAQTTSSPAGSAPAPTVSPAPTAAAAEPAKATPTSSTAAAAEPEEPWYLRVVHWLFGKPAPKQAKAAPAAQSVAASSTPSPTTTQSVVAQADTAPGDAARRTNYASDSSNRTIRSGMTGQCVRMGATSPDAAGSDCAATTIASAPPVKPLPPVVPKSVSASSATMVAVNQQQRSAAAGSAPAPTGPTAPAPPTYAPRLVEPVEVVPLPPQPPAATEEHPLEPEHVQTAAYAQPAEHVQSAPAEHVQSAEEEPITALAAMTPMVSEPEFDKLSLSANGLFSLSSRKIKPAGQEKLDEMVEHLKGMQYDSVLVVGHTDPTGPKALNAKLSKQRAESVKQYLVSKGVDPKRIKTEGKGGAEPLAKTQNCDSLPRAEKIACYAPDRRVEIEVVGSPPHG